MVSGSLGGVCVGGLHLPPPTLCSSRLLSGSSPRSSGLTLQEAVLPLHTCPWWDCSLSFICRPTQDPHEAALVSPPRWGLGMYGQKRETYNSVFDVISPRVAGSPSASWAPFPPRSQVGWLYKRRLGWEKVILSLYEAQLLSSRAPISPPTWASELKPAAWRRPSRILLRTRVRCACVFPPLIIHYSLRNDHTVKLTFLGYRIGWFWTLF